MKKGIIFLILTLLSIVCFSQKKSILFIGNSYTYYNGGLDVMLKNFALSMGDTLEVESLTIGGATFQNFASNSQTYELINSRAWDYVVLQEQSQTPAFPPSQVEWQCYPYAKQLCDSVYANDSCTQVLFFMTWGHKNGDVNNCQNYSVLCTYEGMQSRLRESYLEMAEDNNASAVPVGVAWKYIRENYPDFELYQSDNSHPTELGTYLAACTFYSSIYRQSAEGATFVSNLSADDAAVIQEVASNIVLDSLVTWRIKEDLYLNIEPLYQTKSYETSWLRVTMSNDADSCIVDFGNGMTANLNPATNGEIITLRDYFGDNYDETYNICFYLYRGNCEHLCECVEVLYVRPSDIEDVANEIVSVANLVRDGKIVFSENVSGNYEIYSLEGRLLLSGNISGTEIEVSQLKAGMYLLKFNEITHKIVVE